jgi:hypothetical protein
MTRLWDKGTPLDERVLSYTAGDDFVLDNRLVEYDIRASIAHAVMLSERGLLSGDDLAAIRTTLTAIGEEHARGEWRITLDQEDCQTAIENLLTARIGATGGRLHAGRSRNDQVLAALRLYLRDAAQSLHGAALEVAEALEALAVRQGSVELPGYTHMQQAMPSSVALWALGFAAEIRDDAEGLEQTLRRRLWHSEPRRRPRIDPTPLGILGDSGAGDGGATVARQGRSPSALRNHAADSGHRKARRRPAALLHPGVRFRQSAGRFHDRLFHHAAKTQPRRIRADARPQQYRAGGSQ